MKLVLVGGFLGSGKTTAIVKACQLLMNENKKVAIITNDQGDQLVDNSFVKNFNIPGREVTNGCFCCNYEQLDTHLQSLQQESPEIIFAESVGSCTDLIATIAKPLYKQRPEIETVISIFADAELLTSILEGRSTFLEESVRYIYKKQLEEADLLILNKTDLLSPTQLTAVHALLTSEYPGKIILHQNSLAEKDILQWLQHIDQFQTFENRHSLQMDYDFYGEGESKLAWLDKSIEIYSSHGDAVFITTKIIGSIFDQIQLHHFTIAHLKCFIETEHWKEKISFTTTSTSANIRLPDLETNHVKVLINARIQAEPCHLERLIDDVIASAQRSYGCTIVTEKFSVFKPGYPRPTHRIS